MRVFTPSQGILLLVVYGLTLVGLTMALTWRRARSPGEFLLAGRSIGVLPGAMSIAASWIWAPALFISSQKAYEQGLAGLFWFVAPNVAALLAFAPLAVRIREMLPAGYTLPQFMRRRHGRAVHVLYLIQFLGLQICSFAVQILAGSALLEQMTGLGFHTVGVALVGIALAYSLAGGIRASIVTDFLQMSLILGVALAAVSLVVSRAGGLAIVESGLGGYSGDFRNVLDPWVAYSFGIPVTIGLLAGPIGDQMHWQRGYALRSSRATWLAFLLGAALFAVVPLMLSLLGFVAANPSVSGDWTIGDNRQLIGPLTVIQLAPVMTIPFCIMLLCGLGSTLDSVLCAISSLAAVDLVSDTSCDEAAAAEQGRRVRVARISMSVAAIVGLGIAFIPGLQILHLFLFYGTWRASTMVPTVLSLYWPRLNSQSVFYAILGSLVFGAPVYAAGQLVRGSDVPRLAAYGPHLSVCGCLLVLLIGLATCWLGTAFSRTTDSRTNDGLNK